MEIQHPAHRAAFWITLARSVLALALGLSLIFHPDKTRPMLVNFIGMFWLVAGVMSLRWGASGERARRTSIVVGVVGIVAGVLVLGRFVLFQLAGTTPITVLLSIIVILTGSLHMFEGIRRGPSHERTRSWTSALLGGFEIVLGIVVLVWREDFGSVFYAIVTIWAFVGAFMLLREALRQRSNEHIQTS